MPPRPGRSGAAGQGADLVGDRVHLGDEPGGGVAVGVGGVEPVDVREEDQQVSLHQPRHNGREGVVLADGGLDADFVGGHGVVLVEDGQGAQGEEPLQGVAEMAAAAGSRTSSAVSRICATVWWYSEKSLS